MENIKTYLQQQGIEFYTNTDIRPYLTMGIGGLVGLISIVSSYSHLKNVLLLLQANNDKSNYHFILLGGGSNIIFPNLAPELIVIVNRTSQIEVEPGNRIRIDSGVMIRDLMEWNSLHGCDGMDFLAGIPGTVGGAAAVNAGAFGQSISSLLDQAEIVTESGEIKTVDNSYFKYTYRDSSLKHGNELILRVYLKYTPGNNSEIKHKVDERIHYRNSNHPWSNFKSAGCFFKNPTIQGEKIPAGRLIENSGLKGLSSNHLKISDQHANFVINQDNASFDDVINFEKSIVDKVLKEKGVKLEREVIFITPEGKKY